MEKLVSAPRAQLPQTAFVLLLLLGTLLVWPFDQVRAATMERILAPNEVLDGGQARPVTRTTASTRSDPSSDLYPVHLGPDGAMLDQHGFVAQLTDPKRGEIHDGRVAPQLVPVQIEKGNPLEVDRKVPTRGTAEVLHMDAHRKWVAGLDGGSPVFSQTNRHHGAARSHPLFEIGPLDGKGVGSSSVGPSGLQITLPRDLNGISSDFNGLLGGNGGLDGGPDATVSVNDGGAQENDTDARQDQIDESPTGRGFGPIGGLPLGTQITLAILLAGFARKLGRVFGWLIDKSLLVDCHYAIGLNVIAIGGGTCWLLSLSYTLASVVDRLVL